MKGRKGGKDTELLKYPEGNLRKKKKIKEAWETHIFSWNCTMFLEVRSGKLELLLCICLEAETEPTKTRMRATTYSVAKGKRKGHLNLN